MYRLTLNGKRLDRYCPDYKCPIEAFHIITLWITALYDKTFTIKQALELGYRIERV